MAKEQDSEKEKEKAIRLMLGYLCIANEAEASLVRKVQILDRFDLPDVEIAKICGVSSQPIRDARLRGKKKSNAKKKQI
jgi:coenzyme F420-reducing hydrogenase beta subunit